MTVSLDRGRAENYFNALSTTKVLSGRNRISQIRPASQSQAASDTSHFSLCLKRPDRGGGGGESGGEQWERRGEGREERKGKRGRGKGKKLNANGGQKLGRQFS